MMNILIAEDEKTICKGLVKIIKGIYRGAVIYTVDNEKDAVILLNEKKIKLFLLDIKLKEGSGYDIALKIRSIPDYELTPIIFITSVRTKELLAYRSTHCYSYITKPFTEKQVIDAIMPLIRKEKENKIYIKRKKLTIVFDTSEVIFIEAQKKNIVLYINTGEEQIVDNYPLKNIEAQISNKSFLKCHRSYIVNMEYIKTIKFDENEIILNNIDSRVPIGRTYKNIIRSWCSIKCHV